MGILVGCVIHIYFFMLSVIYIDYGEGNSIYQPIDGKSLSSNTTLFLFAIFWLTFCFLDLLLLLVGGVVVVG